MVKITFMGAGSCVFARNVLGDCMMTPALQNAEIALYDIDGARLEEAKIIIQSMNDNINEGRARVRTYLGTEERKNALRNADFVVNAIQVGGYEPCTVIDFEIPKKYGLRQTIADTMGVGGIMRFLRTVPVMEEFARDMQEVCPDAWLLNYSNPMAMLTGYMLRYTNIKTVGLCHSVQVCSQELLKSLDMRDKLEGRRELIAGINHMAWLLEIRDRDGNDLYPEIRRRAAEKNAAGKHWDMVRYEYINKLGYWSIFGNTAISKKLNWDQKMKMFFQAYMEAKDEGDKIDFDVLFGLEDGYGNGKEVLIYGIDLSFLLDHPELEHASIETYSELIHTAGGVLIHAHPHRVRAYIAPGIDPRYDVCDGAEVFNACDDEHANALSEAAARKLNLIMTSGGDIHYAADDRIGLSGMVFDSRMKTNEDLVNALKGRKGRLVINGKVCKV